MPWKECHVVDERLRFVARLLDGEKMAALCKEFGISRKTGYKIFDRYEDCGVQGLTDRSRRPYRQANQLPLQIETWIVRLKKDYPGWGAPKIRERLRRQYPGLQCPAISTVHAVLDRHGLVTRHCGKMVNPVVTSVGGGSCSVGRREKWTCPSCKRTIHRSGCFVATAVYGDEDLVEVQFLRLFRDHYLLPSRLGRILVSGYYRFGPGAAALITRSSRLQHYARAGLDRMVVLIERGTPLNRDLARLDLLGRNWTKDEHTQPDQRLQPTALVPSFESSQKHARRG